MLKIIFFLFGILFLNQNLFSQRQLSQLWTEVGVSKKVSKKISTKSFSL